VAASLPVACPWLFFFLCGAPASSTTKTGRHDIAEILLKVALNTINQINQIIKLSLVLIHSSIGRKCSASIYMI
jgi:hypothetical protein